MDIKKQYYKHKEIIDYIFWGVAATALNIISFTILQWFDHPHYQFNNAIAWIITVLFAFFTNKIFVFKAPHNNLKEFFNQLISFFGGRFSTLIVEAIILEVGVGIWHHNAILVKIISNIVVTIINYFWAKIISFKDKPVKNN